jgi:adenosylmethionine-8-amino-7-oxononanoate aminotransferase
MTHSNIYNALRQADLRHLWHPYTHINAFEDETFPIIERAHGVVLVDVEGRELLDGISSWWCVNLGHSHPHVVAAIQRQAGLLQHSILGGMSHPNAIRLAERLTAVAPEGLTRAYFCGDGASATEAAMRMAMQYWYNLGRPEKTRMASLAEGYHGDTQGAVGVGFVDAFHRPLAGVVRRSLQADSPHCFNCPASARCDLRCFESMEALVREHHQTLAAVILEPVCQGAAGMRIYPKEYLQRLRALCDRYEVLLIADEIAVGFGRTGRWFACEYAGIEPDLMCVGKGLTAGYLPMSAVLAREPLFDAFRDTPERDRTFYHGHTYCGNPVASAAALAAMDVYQEEDVIARAAAPAKLMAEAFERFGSRPGVAATRTLGMMSSLRVEGGADAARRVAAEAVRCGLFIRPLGDILYLWPPLVISSETMQEMLMRFESALAYA